MRDRNSKRRRFTAAALAGTLATVLAVGWSAGSAFAQSADDDEDVPMDTKLFRQWMKDLGLQRDGGGIEYRERAPLVVPPTRNLPPPQSESAVTANPAWPKDPDVKQRKVAAKRVQITHRWSQEGRLTWDGRWIPTVRLVKVNRSPVTREWITPQGPAVAGQVLRGLASDKAIWIESGDSVGFSMGFTCTAFIAEDEAARFLYWYPSGSLADVMDREVRGRVQQGAAEVAAKYPLDLLRAKKQEIADAVKNDLTNFFAARGVTITTVGMFGGMTYENPDIQKSIDQAFIAQQLKVVAEARFQAQKKDNERIELEANAVAEKARREASGLADAKKTTAAAEAEAIREVNRALNEAQQNPVLYQLKALEVERARVEKWDGKYPTYFMGAGGGGPNLLWHVPTPGETTATR